MSLPKTQKSIAINGKRQPLIEITTPVYKPDNDEVVIRVQWTASTPLDLHRADGGLLIETYPTLSGGGGAAGTVVAIGPGDVKGLAIRDLVTAFAWHGGKQANHQEFITVPSYMVSKVPQGIRLQDAVTVPVNLVSAIHSIVTDLELDLPWPIPQDWKPKNAGKPILIWGAGSSVGIYIIQVLRHWKYTNILAIASSKHNEYLRRLGAQAVFDYTKSTVVDDINAHVAKDQHIPYIIDCIGSVNGTLTPLTKIAQPKSVVAVMLPVIVSHSSDQQEPTYEMDVAKCLVGRWADDVTVRGIRTHFYTNVSYLKLQHLSSNRKSNIK